MEQSPSWEANRFAANQAIPLILWAAALRTVHTHHWFKITLPNTDQAHDKRQWTTTNFSQVQLYIPWWWITYDPKHVGVIFNFMYFKLLYNVDFNL